ncbi:asparagine synthase-related protein [Halobacillus litoralis]
MSAIAGIYQLDSCHDEETYFTNMMNSFENYPADDIGVWRNTNVLLGVHAQWITPESINEPLPYYDSERQLTITADAIIDNRKELFDQLQIAKKKREYIPDSQLILMAYRKWGEESPKYLVGEFAYMIWDERNNKLFGARDFSGSRTLYYYKDHSIFSFSTTIQSLLTLPLVEKKLDERWLAEYLAIPGMNEAVDMSITPFYEIYQLPPSHMVSVSKNKVKTTRYCTITPRRIINYKSDQDYIEAFQSIFGRAVNDRLRTHKNIGAHLSGGLDSGAVASFASHSLKKKSSKLYTFSHVPPKDFEDWTPTNRVADERPYIQSTVKHLGNVSDYYLDFGSVSPLDEIDEWLDIMEMPYKFFGTSNWIKGIYEEAHSRDIGILLNGGRGNLSISWGATINYYASLLRKIKLFKLLSELDAYSKITHGNRMRLLPLLSRMAFPTINKLLHSDQVYNFPELISPELAKRTNVYHSLNKHGIKTTKSKYNLTDIKVRNQHFKEMFSWNATGTLGTKLSLRHSLWKRDPTNDLRVIEFCLSLPEDQYVKNGMDRALIRNGTKEYLPDKVRLNNRVRGAQGVEFIHRMKPYWNSFLEEVETISRDSLSPSFFNILQLDASLLSIRNQGPNPELALDPDFWILMRSIISYRFIKKFN